MRSLILLVTTLAFASATNAYEWAGMFTTSDAKYVWTAQKKNNAYADATMDMVVLVASASTDAAFESLEATANTNLACGSPTAVAQGGVITPSNTACYRLTFDTDLHTTSFSIDTTGVAFTSIWAQHVPTEFERNMHYLQDVNGADVEPDHTRPEVAATATHEDKPWGVVFGATLLVCICTLVGVIFATPCFDTCVEETPETLFCLSNSFAAGALIAAAFYLMLYEATHLIVYAEEAVSTAYWGSMAIAGFMTSHIIEICIAAGLSYFGMDAPSTDAETTAPKEVDENDLEKSEPAPAEVAETGVTTEMSAPQTGTGSGAGSPDVVAVIQATGMPANQVRVLCGVLVGDFMHNLVDGIVIGAAFLGCSDTVAWGITGATIAHEIAQEIADYFVLTDPKLGALTPAKALFLNFLSGTSVIMGAMIIVGQDSIDNFTQGCLLAYGGGIYIQVGASECMPRAHKYAKTMGLRLSALFSFCLGVFAIGIILVAHEHCVPASG